MSRLAKWGIGAFIVGLLLWRCGKGSETTTSATPVAPPPTPPAPTTSPTPSAPSTPPSAFDSLWASATPGLKSYLPYLTLKLSKTAYCTYLQDHSESCGDQFEPDKQYKVDLEQGKIIGDSTWRVEVEEGFGNIAFRGKIGPGPFDVKRSVVPFMVTWPINLGTSNTKLEAAKRRLDVDNTLWKETPEQVAELKFADGAAAREWAKGYRVARMVFKITDATTAGPYPLLIIKELGLQLRELHGAKPETVLAEDLADAPNPGGGKK